MKKSNLLFTMLQVPLDAIMIFLALACSFLIRSEGQTEIYRWTFSSYEQLILISLPIWIIIFFTQGLYRIKQPLRGFSEFSAITISILASWAIFVVGLYFYRSESTMVLPRLIIIYSLLLSFTFVLITRWILHLIQRVLYLTGLGVRQVLIIGNNNSITSFITTELTKNKKHGYRVTHTLNEGDLDSIDMSKIYSQHHFDEVIVTAPNIPDKKLLPILEYCENHSILYKMVPNLFEVHTSHVQNLTFLGIPIIELIYTPLQGWGRVAKRIMDIIGSSIALIIFSPFMLIIAILIKLESKGPVFYSHTRIGQNGLHFGLLKFRTMKIEYCRGKNYGDDKAEKFFSELMSNPELKKEFEEDYKLKNDPRITRVGKILRKTSLDELPQLFNALIGGMSLVGPRPIVDAEMEKYGTYKNKRHVIKPGITGMWQVSGRNNIAYEERINLDSYYIENWSLLLDLSIIFKTIISVFKKNAY